MSGSGTGLSSSSTKFGTLKEITRHRLLNEMLRSCKSGNSKSTWKILIMDEFTVKIMSHVCTVVDTTNEGVLLLEQIDKKRKRLPSMDAIYFIRPSKQNVRFFLSDMSGGVPLYRKAFVFFTSQISKNYIEQIKGDASLRSRISALSEMNLEYYAIDSQGFVTSNQRALQKLYTDEDDSREAETCLNEMATRIGTVFASLREFPVVRYRAANRTMDTTFCDLIPTKLAARIWDSLTHYRSTISDFPRTETCELLILDGSVDQVPDITGGPTDKKDVLLDECDPVWLEIRDCHLGSVVDWLHSEICSLKQNKVARFENSRNGQSPEASSKELKDITEALPHHLELKEKLFLHVEIAKKLNTIVRNLKLPLLSELEQSLVYGDSGLKEVMAFLRLHGPSIVREHMLRFLMIVAAIYPEVLKDETLIKQANLLPTDMTALRNMELIRERSRESSCGIFPMNFENRIGRSVQEKMIGFIRAFLR
ncbi:hypothetical protein OROMI_013150 [Orobanche minor]